MIVVAAPLIRLEHRIASVATVVEELSHASGRELRIRREMRDEFLYVDLSAHPADELMRLIARAASAEWIEDEGKVSLGRSPTLLRRQLREDILARGKKLKARITPFLAPNDAAAPAGSPLAALRRSKETPSPAWYAVRGSNATPGGRFLSRILRALPPEELGRIGTNGVERFALRPNRRQRPLLGTAAESVRRYESERTALAVDLEALDEETRNQAQNDFSLDFQASEPRAVRDVTLIVRQRSLGEVSFELRTSGGTVPETASVAVSYVKNGSGEYAREIPRFEMWRNRVLALSSGTTSIVRTFAGSEGTPSAASRDPIAHEPLIGLMSEPLDRLVEAVGDEAIVAVPDGVASEAGSLLDNKPSLGGFADAYGAWTTFEIADGVLVGRDRYASQIARTKTNRAVLRDEIRRLLATPTLEDAAACALAQNPDASATGFEYVALRMAGILLSRDSPFGLNADALRAYALLSPAQKSALWNGASVPLGELSPACRDALDSLVYAHPAPWCESFGKDGRLHRDGDDPTMLSEGLDTGSRLSFDRLTERPAVRWVQDGVSRVEVLEGIGQELFSQERGGFRPVEFGSPEIAKTLYTPGALRSFFFGVWPVPGLRVSEFMNDPVFARDAKAVPYGKLPAAFLRQIEKDYEEAKRNRGG